MSYFDFFKQILPRTFLGDHLPNWAGLYKAVARQFDELEAAITSTRDQLYIDTATWALPIYEAEYAIRLVDKSNDQARRSNVLAMSRGGLGATSAALHTVLKSYGYETEILEDFANYTVTIRFTDFRGVPPNLNDLKELMRRFVPAHLVLVWSFKYTIHAELEAFTHQQLENMTHEQLETQLPNV